jgi:hypothetical protein
MDALNCLLRGAVVFVAVNHTALSGQTIANAELARLLADPAKREDAIAQVRADKVGKLPLLLWWTKTPPNAVDKAQLSVGLADAFRQLKTTQAIPFLISNLGLRRWNGDVDIWMKTSSVVQERLPAAAALIAIGPEAERALIRAFWEQPLTGEARSAAIFAVSVIAAGRNDPEARAFLSSVIAEVNLDSRLAKEGLQSLNGNK